MKKVNTKSSTKKAVKNIIKKEVKKVKQLTSTRKTKIEPFASTGELIEGIVLFHIKTKESKKPEEIKVLFDEIKQKILLTAQKQKGYLLNMFAEENWENVEFLALLLAIAFYVESSKGLRIYDLFHYVESGIIAIKDIMKLYHNRRSNLFKRHYLGSGLFSNYASLVLNDNVVESIAGKQILKAPTSENKPIPKSVGKVNPLLKSVNSICDELSKYVVGQQKAKQVLATALFEHILRIRLKKKGDMKLDKKNVLLLGPTGSGKTYLCQTLAKIANIPFLIADATQYTASGYVGGDAQDLIQNLADKTCTRPGGTIPLSIVYIDEFDKLKFSKDGRGFDMTRKVQESLLKILESDKYNCIMKHNSFSSGEYDISRVLFIVSGAFSDLLEEVQSTNSIGFSSPTSQATMQEIDITQLAKYGFLPEILGRLGYRVTLSELTKSELKNILVDVKDSPFKQYQALFRECGQELVLPEDEINRIIDTAVENKTGARGLNSILGQYLQNKLASMELPLDEYQDKKEPENKEDKSKIVANI